MIQQLRLCVWLISSSWQEEPTSVPMLFFSQEFLFSFMTVYLAQVVNRKKKNKTDRGRRDGTFHCTCRHTAWAQKLLLLKSNMPTFLCKHMLHILLKCSQIVLCCYSLRRTNSCVTKTCLQSNEKERRTSDNSAEKSAG